MSSKEDASRKAVYQFLKKHADKPKLFTVEHFKAERMPRSTIYDII